MSRIFDQSGNMLGALPSDAVPFGSRGVQTSQTGLMGKFVDADGIVYDASGNVDEPATAAWARELGSRAFAIPGITPSPQDVRAGSVAEQSAADAQRAYLDSLFSNVYTTAAEIPGNVANAVGGAWTITQWIIVGMVALAVIKAADRVPSQGHIKRYARAQVKHYRRRAARYVAGD